MTTITAYCNLEDLETKHVSLSRHKADHSSASTADSKKNPMEMMVRFPEKVR
jgi:hypothetical protein